MDPARYQRLKELFLQVGDLPADEREARLHALDTGEAPLADEVRALLREEGTRGGAPTAPFARPPSTEAPELLSGERSYRVLRELGRGGMGVVFLAERADGDYEHRVALKVLRGGLILGDEALRRFRAERQILARLDHPNVAKLLDGGSSADGVPFLVMECVDGVPIDRYCRERDVPLRERLRLFREVCLAVQHAHQHLVVHRDLKPGNILVTADGVPKLLDFGIARILDPQLHPGDAAETRAGQQPLTPLYASPEQLRGEPAAVASDVYSLGVVLYELLTGTSPYRVATTAPRELAQAISDQQPEAPSVVIRRASRAGVRRPAIGRDLDAVILKALRKEPRERYGSVVVFAEDLQRYLDGTPVAARKGTFAYRAGRFLRRHRWAAAAAGVFLAVVVGFSVSLARQLEETARQRDAAALERDKAERERDNALAVTDFLVDTFKASDPDGGAGARLSAREVLDRGAARLVDGLADRPEVQTRLLQAIGRAYLNLGLPAESTRHFERAVDVARARREVGPAAFGSALVDLAELRWEAAALADAERLYREAVTVLSATLGPGAEVTLTAKNGLAGLLRDRGRLTEAEPMFRELLAHTLGALHLSEPPGPTRTPLGDEYRKLYMLLHNLGVIEQDLGHYDEAARRLQQALAVQEGLANSKAGSVALTLEALGNVESLRQRYASALAYEERALVMRRAVYGEEHPLVADSLGNRGDALAGLGRQREALADYERSLVLYAKVYGREHAAVAWVLSGAANARRGLGDAGGALARHREALAIRERVLGPAHAEVAQSHNGIARIQALLGRTAQALEHHRRAVDVARRALGAEHPDTLECRLALAKDRIELRDWHAARVELEALVPLLERGPRPLTLADARFALARALATEDGASPRALDQARRAQASLRERPDLRPGGVSLTEIEAWLRAQGVAP